MIAVAVRATEADWRALLDALPRCSACAHGFAEVEIGGRKLCCACAAGVRYGRSVTLPHAIVATRIEDSIGPLRTEAPCG